ncbi:hypothetical protein [Herbaspirillum sp. SJZ107]|uniref:hypothetical protein n=1 Tax=Herbaspirillum sp. SJZ107 TaxID=2572881 RepID=UPI0011512242|nr:hypothetical protein [Herbaspirillum sp. SJZ107]TQK10447.1 hypothetical protein FBX97_0363 [Herbaspirillum sp. SJZ107]
MRRIDPRLILNRDALASNSGLRGKPLLVAGAGLFAAGMIAGAALAPRVLAPAPVAVVRGDTLAGFAPDAILSLTWATRTGMTTLQRSSRGARFQVQSTFADERQAQHCSVPADLGGHLARLAEWKARRGLAPEQREREFPVQLGVLDIRDNIIGEPAVTALVFANRDQSALAVAMEGYAGEVILPAAELRWLERACDTLAVTEAPATDARSASLGQWLAEP